MARAVDVELGAAMNIGSNIQRHAADEAYKESEAIRKRYMDLVDQRRNAMVAFAEGGDASSASQQQPGYSVRGLVGVGGSDGPRMYDIYDEKGEVTERVPLQHYIKQQYDDDIREVSPYATTIDEFGKVVLNTENISGNKRVHDAHLFEYHSPVQRAYREWYEDWVRARAEELRGQNRTGVGGFLSNIWGAATGETDQEIVDQYDKVPHYLYGSRTPFRAGPHNYRPRDRQRQYRYGDEEYLIRMQDFADPDNYMQEKPVPLNPWY